MTNNNRKLISRYKNGNYTVRLYDDGTKIKSTLYDEFDADFPDSIDLKITDYCDMNCPMCHESSSIGGRHADLDSPFFDTFFAGTELAIGGGNPLSHPDLLPFLNKMRQKGVICNLTVNEKHLLANKQLLQSILNDRLIWGLGVSLNGYDGQTLDFARQNPTVVLHAICGILDGNHAQKLYNKGLKILLLGYKDFGRGKAYRSKTTDVNIAWVKSEILDFADKFRAVCFDNLALAQLDMRNQLSEKIFEQNYMGDDGQASMYVDMVKCQFAVSSVSTQRYPLPDTIKQAFNIVKAQSVK